MGLVWDTVVLGWGWMEIELSRLGTGVSAWRELENCKWDEVRVRARARVRVRDCTDPQSLENSNATNTECMVIPVPPVTPVSLLPPVLPVTPVPPVP